MSALLKAALARARDGEPVLPVWWTDSQGTCVCGRTDGCKAGKHPRSMNGFYDASLDPDEITGWYRQWPNANIGVRTDDRPRIDIDCLEVAEALGADVALLQTTDVVSTPSGGLHIGLATPQPVASRVLHLSDGRRLGELKAAKAYVLVPPSVIGQRAYKRLSPEGISPLPVEDPVAWLAGILLPFGFALQLGAKARRDYEALAGTLHEGDGRHNALVSYGGKVWVAGMAPATLVAVLKAMNLEQCRPPLPDSEVEEIARHFIEKREPRSRPHDDVTPPDGADFARTDAGNGELFAQLYGDRVRYDHRRRRWLVWAGHWWADDQDGEVRRLAKLATRHRFLGTTEIDDLNERTSVAKFAIASENRQRLDAMLAQAQTEPPVADAGDAWDADPWLLGAANGVIDLRSGMLRSGLTEDRITLHTSVAFDPAAACPRWLQFLDEVFCGDTAVIDFLWRAAGYSITGDVREQCLFLCYGKGSNGKSVLLSVLRAVAGSYAYNAPFSTFELDRRPSIPNDLAALAGRRLVTSSETNEGTRLNEARLKAVTGGDPVTARFLHGEFFSYDPVAKFWLAVNHRPVVTDDSFGFWRRVRLVPFVRVFKGEEADQLLLQALQAELPGILAWAVRGTLEWQRRGLAPPDAVQLATESYRSESDPLAQFIEERCVVGERLEVGAAAAYRAYADWAASQGISERERLTSTKFGARMSGRFERVKARTGRVYVGVGLLTRAEQDLNPAQPAVQEGAGEGLVEGCEPDDSEIDVSSPVIALSRENMPKAFTTLHPVTEDDRCIVCGEPVWQYGADGTPQCQAHASQEVAP